MESQHSRGRAVGSEVPGQPGITASSNLVYIREEEKKKMLLPQNEQKENLILTELIKIVYYLFIFEARFCSIALAGLLCQTTLVLNSQ